MKKILIVDDHPGILRLLAAECREKGYHVVTAANGNEALQKITDESPDLVLMDIVMPVMNGFDMLTRLREYSRIPVIAHSFDAHNKDNALKCGANEFILKPFDTGKLLEKIESIINQTTP